ncbi:hypothetical protein [Streptosporangium sp. NPDC000396]|uniref:hypothetical protein n=1 Tax=Streptosporangium sp. NPDC000396 TaxID=3366185 RepID=UPI0036BD05C6
MVRNLLGFLPWIVYAIIATSDNWRYGAITGFVIAIGVLVVDRRAGKGWDEMVIASSAAVFFTVITLISFALPGTPLMRYGPALVNAWLALTAGGSLLIGRPFTLGIARTMAPREVWDSPVFHRINVIITSVWAVSFTVAAVALSFLLYGFPHATLAVIAIKIAGVAVPAAFTARYPQTVAARYATAA